MDGAIGLHGGGEYQTGDEPFLDALIGVARESANARINGADPVTAPIRIVILPTAAARGRPEMAAALGISALTGRAGRVGEPFRVDVAAIVDATSARDPANVELLASADLIHLPGGDPDLIPTILAGSPALTAIRAARERGAVIAGASAGGMALAEWTWTPAGGVRGLGFVAGLAVVPHYDDVRRHLANLHERLGSGLRLADDVDALLFEQRPEPGAEQVVVVDEQDSRRELLGCVR